MGYNWKLYQTDGTYAYVITTEPIAENIPFHSNKNAERANQYSTSDIRKAVSNRAQEGSYEAQMIGYNSSSYTGAQKSGRLSWTEINGGEDRQAGSSEYIAIHAMSGEDTKGRSGTAYTTEDVTTDKLYLLSETEAHEASTISTTTMRISSLVNWWLRSPSASSYECAYSAISNPTNFTYGAICVDDGSGYVRLALQISLSSELFNSWLFKTAEGGKDAVTVGGGFMLPEAEDASELTKETKPTLKFTNGTSASASCTAETVTDTIDDRTADKVIDLTSPLTNTKLKVSYSGFDTTTGQDHVAAVISTGMAGGNNETYVNYAKLSTATSATDLVVDASQLAAGTYNLYLFSEKISATEDAATALQKAGSFTVTASSTNYGTLSAAYKNEGLTANLGGNFNLSFENGEYDTGVTVGENENGAITADASGTTLAGNISVGGNSTLTTANSFTLKGTNTINGTLTGDVLNIAGGKTTVSSAGSIENSLTVSTGGTLEAYASGLKHSLTNSGNVNFTGGTLTQAIANSGSITAQNGTTISSAIANSGSLTAQSGATINSAITNTASGKTTVKQGAALGADSSVTGGTLTLDRAEANGSIAVDTIEFTNGKSLVKNENVSSGSVLFTNGGSFTTENTLTVFGDTVAIGKGTIISANGAVALGANSEALEANTISVGNSSLQRRITNVAAGTADTDAVNAAQLRAAGQDHIKSFTSTGGAVKAKKADNSYIDVAQLHNSTVMGGSITTGENNTKYLTLNVKDEYTGATKQLEGISLEGISSTITVEGGDSPLTNGANIAFTPVYDTDGTTVKAMAVGLLDEINLRSANFNTGNGYVWVDEDGISMTEIGDEEHSNYGKFSEMTTDHVTLGYQTNESDEKIYAALRPDTLTIDGHDYITTAGINAGGKEIANVKAAELAKNGNYAATTGQLYEIQQALTTKADKATTLEGYGITNAYTKINVDDKVLQLNDRIDNIVVSGTEAVGAKKIDETNDKAASANAAGSLSEAFNSGVSKNSTAGIAIGYGATVGYENGEITTDETKDTTAENSIAIGRSSTVTGANSIAVGTGHIVTGSNSGAFGDPNIVSGSESYAIGNNNEIAGDNNFVLGSNVKITDKNITNSVGIGHNTTVTESNVVSVGSSDNQRRIVNVADGINPTDAANMRQLEAVSGEVREVGAISAALAGLHYVEPSGEGDDKLVGAVAYGGYRGANAEAIGIAYKPNPNMMFTASTSISNGNNSQNAYNAGFSIKFGKGETAVTRAELQKQVKYLNEKTQAQDELIKQLLERIEKLENKK